MFDQNFHQAILAGSRGKMIDWFRTVPMSFLWVCHIGGYGAISHEKLKEFAPIELAQLNVK